MSRLSAELVGPQLSTLERNTINQCVDQAERLCPHRLAVRHYGPDGAVLGSLSFADLADASRRLAGALATRFSKGDAIALWGNNSLGWVVYELAILRLGAVVVTLDPGIRAQELKHMITSSRAAGVIMDREYRGTDLSAVLDEADIDLDAPLFIDEWRDTAAAAAPVSNDPSNPDDPALIVFTSGTTGKPKGVVLHHAGCIGNAREAIRRTALSDGVPLLNPLPAYSVGGAVCITLGALATLRPQVVINHFSAEIVIELLGKEKFGWMPLVPAMLLPLVNHPRFAQADLSSLEAVWMGGTVITPENIATARRALGARILTVYGQTESGGVHSLTTADSSDDIVAQTVGVPLPMGVIRVADLESGATLPLGSIGEICAQSPYMTTGYFQDEDATRTLFTEDGFLRTGDLGMIRNDGCLCITGRIKEMIIRGGRNIYPREIEDLLGGFPGIAEVAVLGIPHERWGEEVAIAIKPSDGEIPDLEAARAFLATRISDYKMPKHWLCVDEFPRGAQAKIRKIDLVHLFTSNAARSGQ